MGLKLYLYLGLAVIVLSAGLYIMFLRNSVLVLESDIKDLKTENQQLQFQVIQKEKQIQTLNTDYQIISGYNSDLAKTNSDLRIQQQELQTKLQKLNSGYAEMAIRHPKMLGNIINNAQKNTNDCFEKLSRGLECNSN